MKRILLLCLIFYGLVSSIYAQDFIDLCGTKWAKGNLQCIDGQWGIAEHQWDYGEMFRGNSTSSTDHFQFGVLFSGAGSLSSFAFTDKDIQGKCYKDKDCTIEGTIDSCSYGDLPYIVSKGKYILPTSDDFKRLIENASYQFGYYQLNDTVRIKGCLFMQPDSGRTQSTDYRELTEEEINNGLFLPETGMLEIYSSKAKDAGNIGYYLSSTSASDVSVNCLKFSNQIQIYELFKWNSLSIRPIINSSSTAINEINIETDSKLSGVYNLQGQIVRSHINSLKELNPGIYIINGKKVLVK